MLKRGIYFRHQVVRFVVLFLERDGSTYMISMLSSHPEIKTVFERFYVIKNKGLGAHEQLSWADSFFTPPLVGREKAIGFKTKLVDVLDREEFAQFLLEKQCRVIHMQRRNIIKAVVSKINAKRLHDRTGNWNLYKEADRLPPAAIDLDEFAALIQEREALDQELTEFVAQLDLPKITICYEDLLQDRDGILRQVFDFLNVKWFPVESKTKKNTQDDLREVIENYDDLRHRYAGTRYEAMFDEVLTT